MILGVFGLPGMGKSTFLAKCAWQCLHGKSFMGIPPHKYVYTNFHCPGCYELDFDDLGKVNIHDALILIDEIMLLADCRDFKNFSREQKFFWSWARHFGVDVCWCSQYYSDCDKKIRNLTSKFFLLEKSSFLPVSFIKPIVRMMGAKDGQMIDRYDLGAPITWRFVWRPKYYKLFDSFAVPELPEPECNLWSPLPDPVPLHYRLTDWTRSPILSGLISFTDWSRSPILSALAAAYDRNRPGFRFTSFLISSAARSDRRRLFLQKVTT